MAINRLNSANSQMYLLSKTAVNKDMIKNSYSNIFQAGYARIAAKNRAEEIMKNWTGESSDSNKSESSAENQASLKTNATAMRGSAFTLASSANASDDDFIKSVEKFAEDYNNTVKTLKKSDNYVAVSSGINMVNTTNSYAASLKRAGVTINDDNTLSVDADVMKKNMNVAKRLFTGNYSLGGKMAKKASDLQTISGFSLNNRSGIYNRYGQF